MQLRLNPRFIPFAKASNTVYFRKKTVTKLVVFITHVKSHNLHNPHRGRIEVKDGWSLQAGVMREHF